MFEDVHFILVADKGGDLLWGKPTAVFLDEPFRSTGLAALYADEPGKYPLPGFYWLIEGIDDFLSPSASPPPSSLRPPVTLWLNPEVRPGLGLRQERELQHRSEGLGHSKFDEIVETADPVLLRSVWEAICSAPAANAVAVYWANASYNSTIRLPCAQRLDGTAWIPDRSRPRPAAEPNSGGAPGGLEAAPISGRWPPSCPSVPMLPSVARKRHFKPVAAKQLGIDLEDVELLKEARAVGITSDEIRELIALRRTYEAFPDAARPTPIVGPRSRRRCGLEPLSYETDIRLRSVVGRSGTGIRGGEVVPPSSTTPTLMATCTVRRPTGDCRSESRSWYFEANHFFGKAGRGCWRPSSKHTRTVSALCRQVQVHARDE